MKDSAGWKYATSSMKDIPFTIISLPETVFVVGVNAALAARGPARFIAAFVKMVYHF